MNYIPLNDSAEESPKSRLPVVNLEESFEENRNTSFKELQPTKFSCFNKMAEKEESSLDKGVNAFKGLLKNLTSPSAQVDGARGGGAIPKDGAAKVSFNNSQRTSIVNQNTSAFDPWGEDKQQAMEERKKELDREKAKAKIEFPNPMEDVGFAGVEDSQESAFEQIDIPEEKTNDIEAETTYATWMRINELKKKRTGIYSSITKMDKGIMNKIRNSSPSAREQIQEKAKDLMRNLIKIMEELETYGLEKFPKEMENYVTRQSKLKNLIAKIDNVIETEALNRPDLLDKLLQTYIQEEDEFSKNVRVDDLTQQFQRNTLGNQTDLNSTRAAGGRAQPQFQHEQTMDWDHDGLDNSRAYGRRDPEKDLEEEAYWGTWAKTRNQTRRGEDDEATETTREQPRQGNTFTSEARQQQQSQRTYNPYEQLPKLPDIPRFNPRYPPPDRNQPPNGNPQRQPLQPTYPQQNMRGQQAYMYQDRALMPNYSGIDKLKVQKFGGIESEFQRFKLKFNSCYVQGRNLPENHLALHLEASLKDRPLDLIQRYMNSCRDQLSYSKMWEILEERYGGRTVEDAYTIAEFKNASPLKNSSFKELERMYDIISIQYAYYERNDPESLNNERSLLMQLAKEKLNSDISMKFIKYTDDRGVEENFAALKNFLRKEFLRSQKREREYPGTFQRGETHSARKTVLEDEEKREEESGTNPNEEKQLTPCALEAQEDDYCFYVENQKTGQKFGFVKPKPLGYDFYGNQNKQQGNQRQGGFQQRGGRTGGYKPPPARSQYIEGQCSCCRQKHTLPNCPKFKALPFRQQSVIIRRDKICYHCLAGIHYTRDCKTDEGQKCGIGGCERYHHKALHRDPNSSFFIGYQIEEEIEPPTPTPEELEEVNNISSFKIAHNGAFSIQTLICNVLSRKEKRGRDIKSVVLIDSGSSMTCIDEDFAMELNLPIIGRRSGTTLHMLERVVDLPGDQLHVELQISSVDQNCTKNITAWTIKNLAKDTSVVDWAERKKQFPYLSAVRFPPMPKDSTIKIIMGVDNSALYAPVQVIHNPENRSDPVAMKLSLGWTCLGRSSPSNNKNDIEILEEDPKKIFKNVVFRTQAKPKQK
jgi:hypothetical protein